MAGDQLRPGTGDRVRNPDADHRLGLSHIDARTRRISCSMTPPDRILDVGEPSLDRRLSLGSTILLVVLDGNSSGCRRSLTSDQSAGSWQQGRSTAPRVTVQPHFHPSVDGEAAMSRAMSD